MIMEGKRKNEILKQWREQERQDLRLVDVDRYTTEVVTPRGNVLETWDYIPKYGWTKRG